MLFLFNSIFFAILPLLFSLVLVLKWLSNPKKNLKKSPPSPPKLPIIGNLHQLGLFPHRSLQSLAQKYGNLMLLHLGSKPVLIVSSADGAREIMKNHDLNFSSRPKMSFVSRIFHDKNIAFAPYGEHWRQARSVSVLQLLSNKRVQSYRRVREEETNLMLEKIKQYSCSSPSSRPVNLIEIFILLTNDAVCRAAFGKRMIGTEGVTELKELFSELSEILGAFNVGDYIPWLEWWNHLNGLNAKVEKVAKFFDEFMECVLEEHMDRRKNGINGGATAEHVDFVDVLLGIQRENSSTALPLHRDVIKAVILDMFIAATEPTANVLGWEMNELLRHPKVMKELQNEVRGIVRGKEDITEDDIEKMPYLKAVIKESLRLHSPMPLLVPREAIQDVKVMGYDVVAGTQVFINAWAIARDPSLWEDPEEFWPERFLNTSIDFKGQNFQFIPFGAGRRGCPGIQFATTLNELALAKLVHKFDFSLPNGARGKDLDVTEAPGMTVNRKYPLFVVPTLYIG